MDGVRLYGLLARLVGVLWEESAVALAAAELAAADQPALAEKLLGYGTAAGDCAEHLESLLARHADGGLPRGVG